jgi:hypothetical protein
MTKIEARIRPLVDALNATGLVQTFSSCEGHYGVKDLHDFSDKEKAEVLFELNSGVPEAELERFFAKTLRDYIPSEAQWGATLTIQKRYIPDLTGGLDLEYAYAFVIRPFNPHETNKDKRRHTDDAIAVITAIVLKNTRKRDV